MSDNGGSPPGDAANRPDDAGAPASEHLNIKVTDNNNEVFFKIKRTTVLKKLMDAFCERQGKTMQTCRFLFDGERVLPTDSPDSVSDIGSLLALIEFAMIWCRRVEVLAVHSARQM